MPEYGDYAFAILTSYGVSICLLAGLVFLSIRRQRKIRDDIHSLEKDAS